MHCGSAILLTDQWNQNLSLFYERETADSSFNDGCTVCLPEKGRHRDTRTTLVWRVKSLYPSLSTCPPGRSPSSPSRLACSSSWPDSAICRRTPWRWVVAGITLSLSESFWNAASTFQRCYGFSFTYPRPAICTRYVARWECRKLANPKKVEITEERIQHAE